MSAIEPGQHANPPPRRRGGLWSLLTFDRLITGPVIHLVYWAGLGVIVIAAFSVIGAAIGVAWREGGWAILLALPALVAGLLAVLGGALLWRAVCEFYVAIFRIGDDLAALRRVAERAGAPKA
jgi:zinc transporter ZupT